MDPSLNLARPFISHNDVLLRAVLSRTSSRDPLMTAKRKCIAADRKFQAKRRCRIFLLGWNRRMIVRIGLRKHTLHLGHRHHRKKDAEWLILPFNQLLGSEAIH